MIATLDTNVLVSGLLFHGVPNTVVNAAIEGSYTLALSPSILTELEGVLARPKFGLDRQEVHVLVRDIESVAMVAYPTRQHAVVEHDATDNAIVDCAVEAKSDYIVSGDRHLLMLTEVEEIPVLSPADFEEILSRR